MRLAMDRSSRLLYTRDQLLELYNTGVPAFAAATVNCVRRLGLQAVCRLRRLSGKSSIAKPSRGQFDRVFLCPYRGCRGSGYSKQHSLPPSLHVDRHSAPIGGKLVFGCINIASLANKLDDLLEVCRDQRIDVQFIVETWHDTDSVLFRRLRIDGYQVVDRPRPRKRADSLLTNHGGVAAVASPGVRLSQLDLGTNPGTFELLCVRIASVSSVCIAAIIYRPGSTDVTSLFFEELSDVLDRLATFVDPVFVVGDVNIHLEKPSDADACRLRDDLAAHGLANRVSVATHNRGGSLDIVATRDDLPVPCVDVIDPDLSDHYLLRWQASSPRESPVYTSVVSRPWNRVDVAVFRAALQSSPLCSPISWTNLDADGLAQLYETEIAAIVDRLVPARTVRRQRRASDPWFDDDCRVAKRCVRLFERDVRRIRRLDPLNIVAISAATAIWASRRREYRVLLREKREAFWQAKVTAERTSPQQLWRAVDGLLGRGRIQASPDISAEAMHTFFDAKVAGVRASTRDAPPAAFTAASPSHRLTAFRQLTADDVTTAIRQLPDKQCSSDPMPTRLLKENADVLAPFLVQLFSRSMSLGSVPTVFKAAYITPLLKKPSLDPADVKSYRPISNLPILSKLLERLVARQLLDYLTASKLLPDLQSAYRVHHSTETAVLKVLADILHAVDSGDLAVLALLDLSAAFDTVDHATLLQRLEVSYGLDGHVAGWFASYLDGRTQFVRCGGTGSTPTRVSCGVPQGSVLGPILFLLYTADLLRLISEHRLNSHLYADDTQVYGSCSPGSTAQLLSRVSSCISDVAVWMRSNRLQLNTDKTEVIWFSSARRQHQIPTAPLIVGTDTVTPVYTVRNLGIHVDSDLSMTTHVSKTVSGCFAMLRQIRSIRRSVTMPVLQTLVVSLVLSRLDYGSATLAGLPVRQLNRLQSVLHAAARLTCAARKYDHITPLLRDLHWLRVPQRIDYRLAVLTFRCLHGSAPDYLARELRRVADIDSRRRLRSSSTASLHIAKTAHKTIGDRAFPVAAPRVWNSLPPALTSLTSLPAFRKHLKTELFRRSFPSAGVAQN